MSKVNVEEIIKQVDELLASHQGELPKPIETAIEKLLNVVDSLCADRDVLTEQVKKLREQLERKKQKNGSNKNKDKNKDASNDHSSEGHRDKPENEPPDLRDRRSGKELCVHEEIECEIDLQTLPADAVRIDDEVKIVQEIEIQPRNIRFTRHVYYSPSTKQKYRAALPLGYDQGDFGSGLRALIVSMKYSGNMSEPKIGEFLKNFDVEVSSGSISNILTKSADLFESEFDDIVLAGLNSTAYQQTDDTSARVDGKFWHTHILCNPYYAAYFTRPHKDRLTVLEILQNTSDLQFQFGGETMDLLDNEFQVLAKWRENLVSLGECILNRSSLDSLFEDWFSGGNVQLRKSIQHAAAIVYYRNQAGH